MKFLLPLIYQFSPYIDIEPICKKEGYWGKKVLSLFVFNIPGRCSKGQAIEPAQYASKSGALAQPLMP